MWILKVRGKYNDIDVETFNFIISVEIDKALSEYSIDEVRKVIYDIMYGKEMCRFNITSTVMIEELFDGIDIVLREQYNQSVISVEIIDIDNNSIVYSKGE